jgi:hypothetical protein
VHQSARVAALQAEVHDLKQVGVVCVCVCVCVCAYVCVICERYIQAIYHIRCRMMM